MSEPTNLATKGKQVYINPSTLAQHFELNYLQSFSQFPISHESIYCYPRDQAQSPLEQYQYVDFEQSVYNQLLDETTRSFKAKAKAAVQGIRCGFKEFYTRVAATTYRTTLKYLQKEDKINNRKLVLGKEEEEYRIESFKGHVPANWPQNIKQFKKQLQALPWHAFSKDSQIIISDFVEAVKSAMLCIHRKFRNTTEALAEIKQTLLQEIEILLGVVLRTTNQTYILQNLLFLSTLNQRIELDAEFWAETSQRMALLIEGYFEKIPQSRKDSQEFKNQFESCESFLILKKAYFQKTTGIAFTTLTTDGSYIYLLVSALNGGLFKIGTGKNDTVAGKIYLERKSRLAVGQKPEEVSWVYLKGKLYVKRSSKDSWLLDVIDPDTFQHTSSVQLICPSLFGLQSLVNINKSSPLLTDGNSLFYLGNRIKITKACEQGKKVAEVDKAAEEPKKNDKPDKPERNQKGGKRPKKVVEGQGNEEKNAGQNSIKTLEIMLYEFNVQGKIPVEPGVEVDKSAIQQLYESFNGYYTTEECCQAYLLHNCDMSATCQWLFDEGEKEKEHNIKMVHQVSRTILCEAEITSNFSEKNLKGPNEITVKEGSLLGILNVNESLWMMDRNFVTCFSETGVKIFSRSMKDYKPLKDSRFSSTLVNTWDNKFPRNPDYHLVYDVYNCLLYTLAWNHQGHSFPVQVQVGKDLRSIERSSSSGSVAPLVTSMKDLPKLGLQKMYRLDRTCFENHYYFNNWLWYYGQKISEIGTQMDQPDSDKKRLSNKRAKLLLKLNKINELERCSDRDRVQFLKNERVVKQIIKISPFSAEGTHKSITMILEAFGNVHPNSHDIETYILCVQDWLRNMVDSSPGAKGIIAQISKIMCSLRMKSNEKCRRLLNAVLTQQFYLLFPTCELQMGFIMSLTKEELLEFTKALPHSTAPVKHRIVYQLTKKEHLVQKYDSKCQFQDIFKNKSNIVPPASRYFSIGNFLLPELLLDSENEEKGEKGKESKEGKDKKQAEATDTQQPKEKKEEKVEDSKNKIDPKTKKCFVDYLENLMIQTIVGTKLFELIFLEAVKILIVNSSKYTSFICDLFEESFRILEKVSEKCKTETIIHNLTDIVLLVVQIYHVSLASLAVRPATIVHLQKLIEHFKKSQLTEYLSWLQDTEYEGVSPTCEKIYQTGHPLQRGKNYSYPSRTFNDASLVLVDFDKRCQSDQNHDIMTIQMIHQEQPIGNQLVCTDGVFASALKMSGPVDSKKPYLIFGNSIAIDFTSSGHAKDAQSFGRYGFRFGVRPVFVDKVKYNSHSKEQIHKVFKCVSNYAKYVNTLKFLTVSTSTSIERLLHLEKEHNEATIDSILNGKIFKQGFEDNGHQYVKTEKDAEQIVDTFFRESSHGEEDREIIKSIHKSCRRERGNQCKPVLRPSPDLWDMRGIPNHIQIYLEQIKEFRGDFIEVFKEAREHAKPTGTYAHIMRKPNFINQYKNLWLQGEAILFLTVLKHSGLLHLDLKFSIEYIKENLKAFEEARNGIFFSFISRMQVMRNWQDLLDTWWQQYDTKQMEKKPQEEAKKLQSKEISLKRKGKTVKTVKIEEKTSKKTETIEEEKEKYNAEERIRERVGEDLAKSICQLKGIKYNSQNLYENVTRIIEHIKLQDKAPFESLYVQPINHLIRSCLFLLRFKSPSTKESLESNQLIVPVVLDRSSSLDNRNVNTNKVELFRQWLENWKKWKGFRKEGRVQLKFPVQEIVNYINLWIDPQHIEKVIDARYNRCENRSQFYMHNTNLIRSIEGTILSKYALGTEALGLSNDYDSELSSVPNSRLALLKEAYQGFIDTLRSSERNLFKKLPQRLDQFQKQVRVSAGDRLLCKIKQLGQQLCLLQNQNRMDLQVALYFVPFKYLSSCHQDLIYVSSLLVQRAFLVQHTLKDIIKKLWKETGTNSISSKRWKDYFFIERELFLLRKLEVVVRKKAPEYESKIETAQILYYILYHVEVPMISKIALRILRKLDLPTSAPVRTPFDFEYFFCSMDNYEKRRATPFKVQNAQRLNKTELMASKISSIFTGVGSNPIKQMLLPAEEDTEQHKYNLVLNLNQEQDLFWIFKVVYYLEEIERLKEGKPINAIKSWEQYLLLASKKKEENNIKKEQLAALANSAANAANSANAANQSQVNPAGEVEKERDRLRQIERLILNVPSKESYISPEIEQQLPAGWFLNYCNIFAEKTQTVKVPTPKTPPATLNLFQSLSLPPQAGRPQKKQNNQNNANPPNGRKTWGSTIFIKLQKKLQDFTGKPLEEPKEGDSAQMKMEFVKAKNFLQRVRRHLAQVAVIIDSLNRTGYYIFKENISPKKVNQICQLITLGSTNRLHDIQIDFGSPELRARLNFNQPVESVSSVIKMSIIKSSNYSQFQGFINLQSTLNLHPELNSFYSYLNKRELALDDDNSYLPYEEYFPLQDNSEKEDVQFGKEFIEAQFYRLKKKCEKVYLHDYPNETYYIGQGGIESGLKETVLIDASDASLTLQSAHFDRVMTVKKIPPENEFCDSPEDLIEKVLTIMQQGPITIDSKVALKKFLLFSFYLRKLTYCDLQFVSKQLTNKFAVSLSAYCQNLHSSKQLSSYQQETQKMVVKLIDNEHEKLHMFGTYLSNGEIDDSIYPYMQEIKLEKITSSNETTQEKPETHVYGKSSYLLKLQPPQIQQNKLLNYWEKNILPKINEFVRTTLKPLEIDDFFEQMRIPLRKNDQIGAKQVGFVICDGKLPNGAVLPDANHNWNSFEIEEIFVGENVLVRLPRPRAEGYSPLLTWGGQEHRLAKVVFIDVKSSSVLIRYRVQQLSIFSYTWVPVNTLISVEKEVLHISTQSIYEQLQRNLQGMICIYSKKCLTKLATVSAVDRVKLIKETIVDMFIRNPISGCFDFPKPNWSMLLIFKKMIVEHDMSVIKMIQDGFSPVRSAQVNLFSDKMQQLNRFDNAKALIVSFHRDSKISICSGVRFYNDKYGYNEIAHVYATKGERSDLQPLEFCDPNIFCKYYTNKDCLQTVQQSRYKPTPIKATVYAVHEMWIIGCYLGNMICDLAVTECNAEDRLNKPESDRCSEKYLGILSRLNQVFVKWLLKKNVTVLCGYLAKLISKITLTIIQLADRTRTEVDLLRLGVTNEQLTDLLAWISRLAEEEEKEILTLYTVLLQNLSETAASILLRLPPSAGVPAHVKATVDLMKMIHGIQSSLNNRKGLLKPDQKTPKYQWQRILQIDGIPPYFNVQDIRKNIKALVAESKGKILCPRFDVFIKGSKGILIVDGWDVTELVEEQVIEKMEHFEEEKQNEEEESMMMWTCEACTYVNPIISEQCEICQQAAPVTKPTEIVYEKVEATDLSKAEGKLLQKEAKSFQHVKERILKYFDAEWHKYCRSVQEFNKEVEESQKVQPAKKAKNGKQPTGEQLKEMPAKLAIELKTGSGVLGEQIMQQFLRSRFEFLPNNIKSLCETEQSYQGKFNVLFNQGYDLWGDAVASDNTTLLPLPALDMLMDYIQTEICKGSSSVLSYSEQSIRFISQIPLLDHKQGEEPINYNSENDLGVRVKYKALACQKSYNIRFYWKIIKELNLAASKCLQYINMDLKHDKERENAYSQFNDCLGYKVRYFRNLIMGVIKLELTQKIIQKTSNIRETEEIPKIYLERLKLKEDRPKMKLVTFREKDDHLFTKAHEQMQKISPAFLRPYKPKGTEPYLSFNVTFKGENVMGEAGPYRQFFTDIANELDPKNNLGLFIPTPNNRYQTGEHKSKWLINPKANSTYHLSLYEFIGTLMGCCLRTGAHIALDLPQVFWKLLTHDQVYDSDLEEIDEKFVEMAKMIEQCPSEQAYLEMEAINCEPMTWIYSSSDGQRHEIIPNGKNIKVEYSQLKEYVAKMKFKRIHEAMPQIKRIIRGLSHLVPLPYLNCLTAEEIKVATCGRPKVDVELLKKHTKYAGDLNENSRRIQYFWQFMREIDEPDKLKVIRFCWGQERLPINSEEFQRNNIRFMIKPMISNNKNQDQSLPKADTCFFNIELPDYSTKTILKEKIMLAVNLDSVSINADQNMNQDDNPLLNEIEEYQNEENNEEERPENGGGGGEGEWQE